METKRHRSISEICISIMRNKRGFTGGGDDDRVGIRGEGLEKVVGGGNKGCKTVWCVSVCAPSDYWHGIEELFKLL